MTLLKVSQIKREGRSHWPVIQRGYAKLKTLVKVSAAVLTSTVSLIRVIINAILFY